MSDAGLRRELGWIHATGVVVGAIIGVGIFLTPSKVAAIAGSPGPTLGLWLLGGLIGLAGGLSLAEVGARFPESGGQLKALRVMLGPLPAFLYGWSLLTAIQTGVLVIICLFGARNLGVALGCEWSPGTETVAATALMVSLAAVNLAGVRQGAWVQTGTSSAKLLVLAVLAVLGLAAALGADQAARGAGAAPAAPPAATAPWVAGLAAVLFSYGGFHQLTWIGGEVRRPERTVPGAIVLGVVIVILSYLAANAAYLALLPFDDLVASQTLAADAIGTVFPAGGRRITAAALCVSAYGVANASFLTAPRVYYSLARDGLFPRVFGEVSPLAGVPRAAILVQVGLALALLWLAGGDRMDQLVTGVVFVDWTFHALACLGLLILRRREGGARPAGAYRTPFLPWTPLVFVAGTAVGLGATFLDEQVRRTSLLGVVWLAAGCLVYATSVRRRRASAKG